MADAPYNVKILRCFVAYLRARAGWSQRDVDQLFAAVGSQASVLSFDDNWFDQSFADRFYAAVAERTGDADIAYKVGAYAVDESAKGVAGRLLASFLTPAIAYQNVGQVAAQYSKGAVLTPVRTGPTSATITARLVKGYEERPYQCRNRTGMLEAIPTFFGMPSAVLEHPRCIHRGDDCCEYRVTWVEPVQRLVPLGGMGAFLATLLAGVVFSGNLPLSLMVASGVGGAAFVLLNNYADRRLRRALNEQIEALRISGQTLGRRHREAALVAEINNLVNRMMPVRDLCQVAAEAIHNLMEYDRTAIFLVDRDRHLLKIGACTGFSEDDARLLDATQFELRERDADSFLVGVASSGKPLLVESVDAEWAQLSVRSRDFVRRLGVRSFVAAPISFEDRVFGVIAVDNGRQSQPLTGGDLELLTSVAKPIGVAFANAVAVDALRRARDDLERRVTARTVELAAAHDEAVQANAAKSAFLASMSHELRTPLNAIIGYAELLKEDARAQQLEAFAEDLDKIGGSGRHLLHLINGVLDMAKIESGKMQVEILSFSIVGLVRDLTAMCSPLAKQNDNELIVECDEDIGLMMSDEVKVRQILVNLLSNAAKFTSQGTITLSAKRVPNDPSTLVFLVKDSGIGIPADKLDALFEEFVQVDSSTTRRYGGTGLGLALTRRFCELLGGDVSVTSEQGKGSTFTVRLPRYLEKPAISLENTG